MSNPFDETQAILTEEEQRGLLGQPMPGLLERFRVNADQAYYTGTIAGGTKGQTVDQLGRDQAVAAYDALPQWETPLEGAAALAGQLYGSFQSPESLLLGGPGAKLVEAAGVKTAPWMARFFAGAIDAGLANAAVDTVVQGAEMRGGDRQSFDPMQTAIATGLGAAIGGTFGAVAGGAIPEPGAGHQAADAATVPRVAPADAKAPAAAPQAAPAGLPAEGLATQGQATGQLVTPRTVAVEPPALGDALDAQARQTRGLGSSTLETPLPPVETPRAATGITSRPLNVFEFMAAQGGLRDDGGELTARGLTFQNSMTKFGPVFRKAGEKQGPDMLGGGASTTGKGLSPDQMRERLVEAGYLPKDAQNRPAETAATDVYGLIDRQMNGDTVVAQSDQAWQLEVDQQRQAAAAQAEFQSRWTPAEQKIILDHGTAGQDLVGFFQRNGFDAASVDAADVKLAAEFMQDGLGADQAFERATIMNVEADFQSLPEGARKLAQGDNSGDIPFWSDTNGPGNQNGPHAADAGAAATDTGRAGGQSLPAAQPDQAGKAAGGAFERGADGRPQSVIPGTEAISGADQAQRLAAQPLKAKAPQNFIMDQGLFGDGHNQKDLFALSTGPRSGMLGRDQAGTAAPAGQVADPPKRASSSDPAVNGGIVATDLAGEVNGAFQVRTDAMGDIIDGPSLSPAAQKIYDAIPPDLRAALHSVSSSHAGAVEADNFLSAEDVAQLWDEHRKLVEQLKPKLDAANKFIMDEARKVYPASPGKPDVLASLATGPRSGQLARDAAGVASAPGQVADPPAIKRLKDTAEQLMTRLDAVAVRMGRIARKDAAGIYKTASGVIRLKKPDDFDVLAHELGHHVEADLGKPVKDLMKQHRAELEPMAYAGAAQGKELTEGFAEFMRVMATNPAYAKQQAPQFDAAFRAMLAKDHPEVLSAITDAATAWRAWLEMPSTQAVASTIVSSELPAVAPKLRKELARMGLGNTISERLSRFYGALMDDLHPINRAVRGLAKLYTANTGKVLDLKVADDAYKLARLSRGAYAAGHQDLMHGVAEYGSGKVVSSSLRDAIVMATGKANALSRFDDVKVKQFGAYLWSRRALGEWERFDAGLIPNPPDKLTRGDHAQNVKDLEAAFPQFAEAAAMVHDFAQALWTKKRDAGLITRAQWADGLKIKDYVPGLRAFDQIGDAPGAAPKRGGSMKGGMVKRFQGSARDVINPLESLMLDAQETANAIARNDVVRALDRMAALAGVGSGAIAERIPSHQMRAVMVDVMEALQKAAKDGGVAEADYIAMRDMVEGALGEDARATLFRPAVINEKGEAIAFFREGGELQALRLADGQFGRDMQRALSGMTRAEKQIFDAVSLPLAKAASVARLGVVADIPFLIKNFIRDQMQAFLYYGGAGKNLTGAFAGMRAEVVGKDIARAYNVFGGIMGGANTATVRDARVNRSLNALARKGWAANRFTSFKGLLEATEISETGMRLNLFARFTDEAKARGLRDHEAMLEGAWQARDYIDFDRRGSMVTPITRLVPFLNASLQGLEKFTRQMIVPLFREGVTVAEQGERAVAMKAWARVSAVMVGTLALHALMSEDDVYNDADPDLKARNWLFKWDGKYVAIPKPFEAMAFINMGPAIFDGVGKHDPRWADTVKASLRAAFLPPDIVLGNPIVKTTAELYTGNDLRTGSQIIPNGKEALEPMLQFTSRSSAVARAMGGALNVPPVWVDQMILNFTTSLGRSALSLSDYAMSDKPIGGWDDFVITSSFIKDVSRNASSSRAFWDLVGQKNGALEGRRKSYEALVEGGDMQAASDYLNQQDDITKAWVMLGSTKPEVRRLHPFTRARNAVTAIRGLRDDMMEGGVKTADGEVAVTRRMRGAADDILSKLAMAEARNALVMMGVPGWKGRDVMETAGYYRELAALDPGLARALADRFATAKVLPLDTVEELWPEVQRRLLKDGGGMLQVDLAARAKAAGFEGDGKALKRKPRVKVAPGG